MGFFKDWLKSILEIADDESTKPTESTIAFLTETNVYLTRKLQELEKKPTHAAQPQTCNLNTQATPMVANKHPTWATVVTALAKTNQPTTQKPTKLLVTLGSPGYVQGPLGPADIRSATRLPPQPPGPPGVPLGDMGVMLLIF